MKYCLIVLLLINNILPAMDDPSEILALPSPYTPIYMEDFDERIPGDKILESPVRMFYLSDEERLEAAKPLQDQDLIASMSYEAPSILPSNLVPPSLKDEEISYGEQTVSLKIPALKKIRKKRAKSSLDTSIKRTKKKRDECRSREPGRFPCDLCGKVLRWSWGLTDHIKRACPENPAVRRLPFYSCTIAGCSHKSKRPVDLARHEALPHPLKRTYIRKKST